MKIIRLLLLTCLLAVTAQLAARKAPAGIDEEANPIGFLMPKPHSATLNGATFSLNRTVRVIDATGSTLLASLFDVSQTATATVTVNIVSNNDLATFDYTLPAFPNEGYRLTVTADAINITAATPVGVIRAAQTLMQLAAVTGGENIPGVTITDYPSFKLRGFMHDVGRSFISFNELKKEIDLLSRFKINVFHWHLTDNQAFRFESKLYPQLNQTSNMTRFAGNYYTQEQCTELEAYAAERGVIIVPEIDMPGHSSCFTNAMGFNMSSTQGRAVLKDLLNELAAAFPLAPYIHMGADEAGTTAEFVNEMSQYIHEQLGRKCLVWNPISGVSISKTNLPYIDMTEMWSTSGRKIDGLPNIDCRYNYINHFDVFADLVGIYKSNIYYAQQGNEEIAGAITAVWNDRKTPSETDIIAQNNLYANAMATAERGWIGGGKQYIETGGTILPNSGDEYEEFCDWERRFLYYKDLWLTDEPIPYVKQTNIRWRITDAFPNSGNAATIFPPELSDDELLPETYTYNGKTYSTGIATGAAIYLRHTWGTTVPAYFSSPANNSTAYAWTYIYSPEEQTVGAQIEFQNYGRSENDQAPANGNWDRKGSKIYLNDVEILPPAWQNAGRSIGAEVDLLNENFPARTPVTVTLKKGWNKVFLKLPYVGASGVRLNKWMFTFVLTDVEGKHAIDNVIYSPNQCIDDAAESVATKISEINQYINSVCSDAPGYYPTAAATEINATMAAVKATLKEQMTDEERASQITQLDNALATFQTSLASLAVNTPLASTDDDEHYYVLYTPLRGSRYITSTGVAAEVTGINTPVQASYWKMVARTDGTFDLVNFDNASYLSPSSSNNTVLYTQATQPAAGWRFAPADELGYLIITSTLNNCQINQTNLSSSTSLGGCKVYNWGGGTNTSDTGCKYRIEEVAADILYPAGLPRNGKYYTITNIQQDGTTYTLTSVNNVLNISSANADASMLGTAAVFRCKYLGNGIYNFINKETGDYLIWRGNTGGGYNSNKGFMSSYNATYCNWTLVSTNDSRPNTFYMYSKRSDGTTNGALVVMRSGRFDAYSNAVGYTANYSNLFVFNPLSDVTITDAADNTTVLADNNGKTVNLTLQRSLVAGSWNTLAMPFSINAEQVETLNDKLALQDNNITLKRLASSSLANGVLTLTFEDATGIDAGTPYLAKVTKELDLALTPFEAVTLHNVLLPTVTDAVIFTPTLGTTAITGNTDELLFLGSDNTLYRASSLPVNLKGFRAYFQLSNEAVSANTFIIDCGNGEINDIRVVNGGYLPTDNFNVYDLQGRRVNEKLSRGIYIVNGKKMIVK